MACGIKKHIRSCLKRSKPLSDANRSGCPDMIIHHRAGILLPAPAPVRMGNVPTGFYRICKGFSYSSLKEKCNGNSALVLDLRVCGFRVRRWMERIFPRKGFTWQKKKRQRNPPEDQFKRRQHRL